MINGISAAFYGNSNIGSTIHRCKYENGGDYPDFLLKLALKAFNNKFSNINFDIIVYVPPTKSGNLVRNFAEKISQVLKIPISHNLIKIRNTEPQKIFENMYLKMDNVEGAFSYTIPNDLTDKNVLLIDDIFDSGATIREIGKMMTKFGAKLIAPLTIAKTVGGDLKK